MVGDITNINKIYNSILVYIIPIIYICYIILNIINMRKKLKDYTEYHWSHNPEDAGNSKHKRNLRRCVYESFTYKLEDNGIPYQTVGSTLKLIVNEKLKINPVLMTIQFIGYDKVYEFNSKVSLFDMVLKNCK